MFDRVVNGNALPALERSLQFAAARQELISNNIANAETPGYRPMDVSVEGFQSLLRDAIDDRQRAMAEGLGPRTETADGGLKFGPSQEVRLLSDGTSGSRLMLEPTPIGDGIMYHDGNDRSMERILQSLAENVIQFRVASLLIRRHFASLDTAIRERL